MFQVEKTGEPDPRPWSGLPNNRRRTRHLLLSWSKPWAGWCFPNIKKILRQNHHHQYQADCFTFPPSSPTRLSPNIQKQLAAITFLHIGLLASTSVDGDITGAKFAMQTFSWDISLELMFFPSCQSNQHGSSLAADERCGNPLWRPVGRHRHHGQV